METPKNEPFLFPDDEREYVHVSPEAQRSGFLSSPDFRARLLSSLILAPVVLGIIAAGGIIFYGLIIICATLMMREWDGLTSFRMSNAWGWAGVAYVTATCLSFIILRQEGLPLLLFLLATIWATDIGAYFTGRQIGGPKLVPRISPNKTWAGLIGGVIAAVAVGLILFFFFAFPYNLVQAIIISASIALLGQAGDLFESWLKRQAGVKDSGTLIPGHGGLLDRVDGFTFTAPFLVLVYYILTAVHVHTMPPTPLM